MSNSNDYTNVPLNTISRDAQLRQPPCVTGDRLFFCNGDIPTMEGLAVNVWGKYTSPERLTPAKIPNNTPAFKFGATFKHNPGHFVLRWRINALENFSIQGGLRFSVKITYPSEPDTTGSFDVIMSTDKLKAGHSYSLKLEELVVVQPYLPLDAHDPDPKAQWAIVEVTMLNCEGTCATYSGLQVVHVELQPFTRDAWETKPDDHVVEKAHGSRSINDDRGSPVISNPSDGSGDHPITRLAWSKGGTFLAALALSKKSAFVSVWDTKHILMLENQSEARLLHRDVGTITPTLGNKDLRKLSIGLAISPDGSQVAVYQEPMIGQWVDGHKLEPSVFKFCLLSRHSSGGAHPQNTDTLHKSGFPNPKLKNFFGFGTFLTDTVSTDRHVGRTNSKDPPKTLFVACNGIYVEVFRVNSDHKWESMHTIRLKDIIPTLSRRITCKMMMDVISSNTFMWLEDNGLCCAVWDLWKGSNISYISSTRNAKFRGTTFRGNNKMAISPDESIVALARDGNVTTYYTRTGVLVLQKKLPGYKVEYLGFHGQDNQLFVIVRNTQNFQLKTWIVDPLHVESGIDKNPPVPIPIIGRTVLAFLGGEFGDNGLMFDADGTNIRCYVTHTPFNKRIIDKTQIHPLDPSAQECRESRHDSKPYKLKTAIHQQPLGDGDGLMYWVHRVEVTEVVDTKDKTVFSFVPEPWMRVLTTSVREPAHLQSVYFLPGRERRDDTHSPEDDDKRFVVIGVQTIQVWSLPSGENNEFTLEFIWSRPRTEADSWSPRDALESEPVGEYYRYIRNASVYYDRQTKDAAVNIKLMGGHEEETVRIPLGNRTHDIPDIFLGCIRSVYLLADAYVYSLRTSKKHPRNSRKASFTYEEHYKAITRFARRFVNRPLRLEHFSPAAESPSYVPANPQGQTLQLLRTTTNTDGSKTCKKSTALTIVAHGLEFVKQIWPSEDVNASPKLVTLLTLLMDQQGLEDANHGFVDGLLNTGEGGWVPHIDESLSPIKRAVKLGNLNLLQTLIDYCVTNAKKTHPAYLTPVVQSVNELSERYPEVLCDLLKKTSFIPAHNSDYIASHAIVANLHYSDWITFFAHYFTLGLFKGKLLEGTKNHSINHYKKPIFSLRSQLPLRSSSWDFCNIGSPVHWLRKDVIPPTPNAKQSSKVTEPHSHKIYVAPFPNLSSFGSYHNWTKKYRTDQVRSDFTKLSGRSFFDSPVMQATLEFKWQKYGQMHWVMPFLLSLMFFAFMMAITFLQIDTASPLDNNKKPAPDQILSRYLLNWHWLFILTVVVGFVLFLIDVERIANSTFRVLKSPYLYMRATAYVLSVVGCIIFMIASVDPATDTGPSQIWWMSYAILALYLNMLFELRVFRRIGVPVYIIMKIMGNVLWFFLILALFIISFTHALLHLLHTRRYHSCTPDVDCAGDEWDNYPRKFYRALSATTFFLAGRFDPVGKFMDQGMASFLVMMVIFYVFTSLLIFNILIAWMGHAFSKCKQEGKEAWHRQMSEVIADVEMSFMSNSSRYNRNLFPDYIYYGACEKMASQHETTFSSIGNKSNLSLENRFMFENLVVMHDQTHSAQQEMKQDISGVTRDVVVCFDRFAEQEERVRAVMELIQRLHPEEVVENLDVTHSRQQHIRTASSSSSISTMAKEQSNSSGNGSGYTAERPFYPGPQVRQDLITQSYNVDSDISAHTHEHLHSTNSSH
ncbi:hypothetical protein B0O80DRAFT_455744 [Mortierella sp. GBAus27b]|nr:hypothetical protein BGX31_007590 [Mortierella sp. GBA43]KAI8351668.1 hypothetical protein B0O80DRAFT_455744 [Mortierella sp. GBAus27b]